MPMRIALISLSIEDTRPFGPFYETATGGVVDLLAPDVVWFSLGFGGSHARVDALLTTDEQDDVCELVLEWEVINNEAVELEASEKTGSVAPMRNECGNDSLQGKRYGFLHARLNPCLADAVTIEVLAIAELPVEARLATVPSISVSAMLFVLVSMVPDSLVRLLEQPRLRDSQATHICSLVPMMKLLGNVRHSVHLKLKHPHTTRNLAEEDCLPCDELH